MPNDYPSSPSALLRWTWPEIEPHYHDLEGRPLGRASVAGWLPTGPAWESISRRCIRDSR